MTHLGPYEIISLLGAGGMGEVHRARDTRLGREVAIKVLPDAFARDADRLARFQREAQVLASLNHPHIATIHDLQEHEGTRFLVLELVEGETLADRIARGPIPVEEALQIAKQIAEGFEAAHEKGIVHRDLKPANVKVTPEGKVKVLDFGLAKIYEADAQSSLRSNSPTLSAVATGGGVILGTAAYMSPEQARGKPTDKRTDIWAFGCVLYEMLTGQQCFAGETISDSIAAILSREPDWNAVSHLSASVQSLLRRCLQKEPQRRLRDIGEARIAIDEILNGQPVPVSPVLTESNQPRSRNPWIVVGILVLAIIALAIPVVRHLREVAAESPEMRVDIVTPATSDITSIAISPDGRRLAFVATADGSQRLWLRQLDKVTSQPLSGTEGAQYPFWSANSRTVAFFASGKLRRFDIDGGPAQDLASAPAPRGGTWNSEGIVLFAPNSAGGLVRMSETGGEPTPVTTVIEGEASHRFPRFLPDGRHFLFFIQGTTRQQGIYFGSLDSNEKPKRLIASDTAGGYVPPGGLMFLRQGTLIAQRFDALTGTLSGDTMTVADSVGSDAASYIGAFSMSSNGAIAYRAGGAGRRQLRWFDRTGKQTGVVGEPDENNLQYVELSPDERHVAVARAPQGNTDIWLIDTVRGVPTRFTFDSNTDNMPLWSPDGTRIVFRSSRTGAFDLFQKSSTSAGEEEVVLQSKTVKAPLGWSPDGKFLLFYDSDSKNGLDIWVLPMTGDRKPFPFVKTQYDERNAQFSPDGRWIAYQSSESGRFEIYVQPFPGPGGKWQVSTNGGIAPRWRRDGKELFYLAPDSKLMAATVRSANSTFDSDPPISLFSALVFGGGSFGGQRQEYDVSSRGQFLMLIPTEDAAIAPITLLLNWHPEHGK